jgi:hypothetical protein
MRSATPDSRLDGDTHARRRWRLVFESQHEIDEIAQPSRAGSD